MNVEKLKRLQAQVRIGGKGTPRRKKKVMHQTATTDDKKLQSSLKKLSVSTIPGIEEVNIIKDDLTVIHFNNPKAQASLSANTFAVTGHGEPKKIVEMLPEILPQLGQETVVQLRMFANSMSGNQGQGGATACGAAVQNVLGSVVEEDDVPMLVSDFEEVAKMEAVSATAQTPVQVTETVPESSGEMAKPLEIKPETATNILNEKQDAHANLNANVAVKPDIGNKPTDKTDIKAKDDKKQKKQKDKPETKATEKPKNDAKVAKKPAEQKVKGGEEKNDSDNFNQKPLTPVVDAVEMQQDLKTEKTSEPETQAANEKVAVKVTEAPLKPKAEKQAKKGSENKPSPAKQETPAAKDAKAAAPKTATEKSAKKTEGGKRQDNKELQKDRPAVEKPTTTPLQAAVATIAVEPPKETSVVKKEATPTAEPPKETSVEKKEVTPTAEPPKETPVEKKETMPTAKPPKEMPVEKKEATPTAAAPPEIQNKQITNEKEASEKLSAIETNLDTKKKEELVAEAPLNPVKLEVKQVTAVTPTNPLLVSTTPELKEKITIENQVTEQPKPIAQRDVEPKDNIKAESTALVDKQIVTTVIVESKTGEKTDASLVSASVLPEIKEVNVAPIHVTKPITENKPENKPVESTNRATEQLINTASPALAVENKEIPVAEEKIENQTIDAPTSSKLLDEPLIQNEKVEKHAVVNVEPTKEAEVAQKIVPADAMDTAELEKPPQQPAAQLQNAALQAESAQRQKVEAKLGSTTPTATMPKQKVSPPKQAGNNKKSSAAAPEAGKQQQTKSTTAGEAPAKPAAQSDAKKADATKPKQPSPTKPQQQQQSASKTVSGAAKQQQATAKSAPTTPTKTPDKPTLAPKPATAAKSSPHADGAKKANSPQGAAKAKQAGAKNRPAAAPAANTQTAPKAAQPAAPKPAAAAAKPAEIADKKPDVAPAAPTTAPATVQAPAAPK